MADEDDKPNIGAADASSTPGPEVPKPPKKFGRGLGLVHNIIYGERFANGSAWIQSLTVDGQPLGNSRSVKVGPGSEIIVIGGGLNNIDVWEIKQAVKMSPDPFSKWIPATGRVVLNLSDIVGGVVDGAFELHLFSTKYGGGMRKLPVWFLYQKVEESQDQSRKSQAGEGGQESPEARVRAARAAAAMKIFTEAGEKAIEAAIGGTAAGLQMGMGQGTSAQAKPAQAAQSSGVTSAKSKIQTEAEESLDGGADADYAESTERISGGEAEVRASAQATVRAAPETVKQSAEIVGEYIDKRPEIIAHAQTREKVLGALKTGNLGSLSREEHASLQSAVKTISSAPGGVSAQVQTAAQMVGSASSQIIAKAQVQGETKVEAEAKVSSEVKAAGQAEVSAKGQVEASRGTSVSTPAPTTTGQAGALMNLRQSAEAVGEYIDKHPQAVPDAAARNRILQALSGGNLDGLSESDKRLLIEVLKPAITAPNQPKELQAAMENVIKAAQGIKPSAEPPAGATQTGAVQPPTAAPPVTSVPPLGAGEGEAGKTEARKPLAEPAVAAKDQEVEAPPPGVQAMIDNLEAKKKPLGLDRAAPPGAPAPPLDRLAQAGESPAAGGQPAGGALRPGGEKAGEGAPEKDLGVGPEKGPPESPIGEKQGESPIPSGPEKGKQPEQGEEKMPQKGGPLAPSKSEKPEPLTTPGDRPASPADRQKQADRVARNQQRALKTAYQGSGLIRKLAEKKGIKDVEQLAGLATSQLWRWAAAGYLPSFTASIFLMDFYWLRHRGNKILYPMAGWMKIVTLAGHLLQLLAIAILFFVVISAGCQIKVIDAGICKSFESLVSSATGRVIYGDAPLPSAPPGARCGPVMVGPATPAALSATCLAPNAAAFSILANVESGGGDPGAESGSDECKDGNSFSIGLYQINLIAHGSKLGSSCKKDNLFQINGTGTAQGNCLQKNDKGVCLKYDCTVIKPAEYQTCKNMLKNPETNINIACQLSGNGSNLQPWAYTKNLCGL